MFHILIENSTPNHLVGGPWTGIRGDSSNVTPSIVECGLKGGQIREALSQKDFRDLLNSGKLTNGRCCKVCLRKAGGKSNGKRQNKEAVEGTGSSEE